MSSHTAARPPAARVVLLTGPSGSGKSSLAARSGLPVLNLDDFYKEATDPTLPPLPDGGGADWDSPLSWDATAAVAAIEELCRTGRTAVPVYDIAASARTGETVLERGEAPLFVAEGIFAADIVEQCRTAGLLADALCLRGRPATTFRRRLARDLREGRKPVPYLLRRGLRLLRAERAIVARHAALGAHPCAKPEALARIAAARNAGAQAAQEVQGTEGAPASATPREVCA
ncbi:ATP-binding protein [Streptomyces sp. CB02923]|uniref:uridine kinase family protein n=1 Tax=Streptomyces sp. CB02923 TaxID=1718985 RepID=UPI00093BB896|nr:ATP-binding protein [Streptomyces sp. CB02923]OKI09837.1 ATP-binding protein [Streptomyces sp. CB02923]